MDLLLKRTIYTDKSTIGDLFVDGNFECATLELSCRKKNDKGELAIPTGRYPVELTFSPKFNRIMPLINNVPGREGIRIHWANWPYQLEGCVAVGRFEPEIAGDFISNSHATFDRLYPKIEVGLKQGPVFIDIT